MSSHHDYDSEREALFGAILRMQQQIEALNARIEHLQNGGAQSIPMSDFSDVEDVAQTPGESPRAGSLVKFQPFASPLNRPADYTPVSPADVQPATPVTLEDTERDTIRRALERNGGKRKDAARELNISERTLYRKIKEYGLEM